tara:strand:+ start:2743 stop:3654 length:912 start_codon:yes stop_codon:yes gene_type:complete
VNFELTILGSGSAVPTPKRNPSSQFINCHNRRILIDCGEGAQFQIRKYKIKLQSIQIILISHLHGDHYFGLAGLLSTMNLLGRDGQLTIYGPVGLEAILRSQLKIGDSKFAFDITFKTLFGKEREIIFEDKKIEIHTFPLKHKIETNGFLIKEKEPLRKLKKEAIEKDDIAIEYRHRLQKGEKVVDASGKLLDLERYSYPPKKARSYAYCSDTMPNESNLDVLNEVNIMYHEATFVNQHKARAKSTMHSTAEQAATFAKKAKAKKLILGHFSNRYLDTDIHKKEASAVFENVIIGEDGMQLRI